MNHDALFPTAPPVAFALAVLLAACASAAPSIEEAPVGHARRPIQTDVCGTCLQADGTVGVKVSYDEGPPDCAPCDKPGGTPGTSIPRIR